jgi:hypothetical protein
MRAKAVGVVLDRLDLRIRTPPPRSLVIGSTHDRKIRVIGKSRPPFEHIGIAQDLWRLGGKPENDLACRQAQQYS